MIAELSKLLLKHTHKRLRPSDQVPAKGIMAFFNKPAIGLGYWLLVWLTALILQMVPNFQESGAGGGTDQLVPGRVSPLTIVAAIDFHHFDKQPARVASRAFDGRGRVRPHLAVVPAGTVLVERGQKIDEDTAEKIRVYRTQLRDRAPLAKRLWKLAGNGLILLLGLMVTSVLFRYVCCGGIFGRPRVLIGDVAPNSMVLLFLLVSLLSLAPIKWLLWMEFERLPWLVNLVEALMPLALAPLLMSMLINPLAGMVVGFWVSFAAAGLADYRVSVLVTGLIITAIVVRLSHSVRTRLAVFRIGIWAGLAGVASVIGFALIGIPGDEFMLLRCLTSLVSGVLAALVVMLLLPLLELVFGISTDISLLELADLEHPLLKRLAIEAPGTYHHSLMVANLTQAAVAAIGGNALRARICAYFHDIGKLVKPAFFSENIQYGHNPHDDLSPSMSTLVIISHVKEGVSLALRHKLPRAVLEAIQQHHGSGLVFYFYHKANAQRDAAASGAVDASLQEEDFLYPGPKPQSREIAVLSLADAVEAASRSLEKISPGNIEELVHDAIDSKLRDGQLDACDLTMSEISTIRRVLVLTLSNIMHGRVAYPSDESINPQSPDAVSSKHS